MSNMHVIIIECACILLINDVCISRSYHRLLISHINHLIRDLQNAALFLFECAHPVPKLKNQTVDNSFNLMHSSDYYYVFFYSSYYFSSTLRSRITTEIFDSLNSVQKKNLWKKCRRECGKN